MVNIYYINANAKVGKLKFLQIFLLLISYTAVRNNKEIYFILITQNLKLLYYKYL